MSGEGKEGKIAQWKGKGEIFMLVVSILFLLLSAISVSAVNIDLPPTITLSETYHNSANSTSILLAVASDLGYNAGLKKIELYEDGNLIHQVDCGGSTSCTLTKTVQHVTPGSHTFVAKTWDKANKQAQATLTIYFEGVNRPPQITSKSPASDVVSINEGSSQTFSIIANDPDGDVLSYSWKLDGNQVSTSTSFTYSPNYFSSGQHSISVTVSDGKATASTSWSVYVNNVLIPISCSLSFSKSSPISYTQQPFTVYCSCNSQEASAKLSRNGQDVTNEIGKAVTLPAGSYSYVCSVQQTANYAGSSTSATFVINKATTTLTLDALPSWNVDEGNQTTVSCSANNNEVLLSLYRNSLQVTSGYGSISETATLPAGSYVYVCNTTGSQNYTSASTSNTLTVSALPDTTSPVVSIISPENTTYSTSLIELNYTATDNIAISSCWYDLNGNITQLPGCQNTTLSLGDGSYTLTVYANDTSGNVGSAQVAFTISTAQPDTVPPTINSIIDAPDPVTQGNNITFRANVTDNVAVDTVLVEIQGTNYTMGFVGNDLWEFVFNTSSLAPGIYSYVVYANDTSGNVATATGDFDVSAADVQAPTVTLISPSDGSTNGPDVTLTYNVSDDTDALLNCNLWTNVTSTWQVSSSKTTPNGSTDSFTLLGLPDGTYIWNVECIDDVGNAAFAPNNWTYIVNTTIPDTNTPAVTLISPSDGETINSPNVTVVWNVTDNVDLLLDCEVYSNTSGAWQVDYTISVPNASSGSYTFTNLPQGTYIWNVKCIDDAGNAAFADQNWSFTVAIVAPNQPPQITLNLPEDNAVFYVQDINFNFTATDDYNTTLSCSIYLDGNLNQTNDSVQNGTLTNFLIEGISYGTHQWYVNCSDGELNNASETRNFNIVSAVANWPVFSEVLYDAINEPSGEWIELYNPTSEPVDISGWIIEDNGGNWTIPAGTVIDAGQFITIARNATEFYNMYGCLPHLTYNKQLANTGNDWLRLYNGSIEIDMVRWKNASVGWPIYANENKSIQRQPPWQDTNTSADWINDSLPTPACIQPTYSVDVWADSYYKQISRGQNATYVIYINNTGNIVNTFNLTVQNFDNADVAELNISTITLNPGQVGIALLVVSDSDVGMYNVIVTAIDSDNPSVYDITDNITTVVINNAPVANNDSYSVDEDNQLVVDAPGVLANDSDADGDALTAILITNVSNGTLIFNANGSFTYIPNPNFNGIDSFTYVASDGIDNSSVANVTIVVNPVNDAPIALDDNYVTDEDVPLTISAPGVLANDTDVENDSLSAVLVTNVAHGNLTLNSNGSFVYVPDPNFNGQDSFTYQAYDGQNYSNLATVTITVNPVPDYSVSIASDSYYKEVGLLQPATYLINVTNTGDTADSYTLSVNNINGADQASLNETAISNLAPGQSYIVSLTVSDSNPGIYNVTVTASGHASATTPIITTNVTTTDTGWIYNSTVNGTFYVSQSTGIFNNINDSLIKNNSNIKASIGGNFEEDIKIVNSNIDNSTVENSWLTNVNATASVINNSILTNCVVINATVKGIIASDCYLANGIYDPPQPTNNLTGSNLTNSYTYQSNVTYSNVSYSNITYSNVDHSTVINSNITYSNISNSQIVNSAIINSSTVNNATITNSTLNNSNVRDSTIINSNLTDSDVTGSQVTNSTLTNSTVNNSTIKNSTLTNSTVADSNLTNVNATNSTIENSTLQNATLIDANLTNGVLYNGVIITQNFTYNATGNSPLNLSNSSALPTVVLSIVTSGPYYEDMPIIFNAAISGQFDLANNVTYWWDWTNDGAFDYSKTTNATSDVETHVYGKGSYTIRVKVNDTHGTSAWATVSFTVKQKYVEEGARGGGGGGGRAGAAANVTNVTNATQPMPTSQPQPQPQPKPQPPKPAMLISNDGLVIIKLGEETKVYSDGEEIDISQIKIEKLEGDELKLVPLPQDVYLIRVYKITPPVKFSEDVMLVVKYKEHLVPDANLFVYVYDKGWRKLEVVWDRENKQLVGLVNSATLVGLFTDKLEYKKTWTAAVVGWLETNWYIPVMGILGLIIVISAIALVIKRRR